MKPAVRVAVTGAAGHLTYGLLFKIAAGEMLGRDQPVILQLLEIPPAMDALRGVVMELEDCAYPLLDSIVATDDAEMAFRDADFALLVGAKPRGPGMERKDLLQENAKIFSAQGQALNAAANRRVKVLVVGNPANTNALITLKNAPDIEPAQFSAMTRLDHNRALSQLAHKTGTHPSSVRKLAVWGNHSATQYPDMMHATVAGQPAVDLVDQTWIREVFIPSVQKRGAAIIKARGASSAASAASAAVDHIRDWALGSADNDWVSMAVSSDGSYGVDADLIYSFPVTCNGGNYSIVQGLDIDDFSRGLMRVTEGELKEERDGVRELL